MIKVGIYGGAGTTIKTRNQAIYFIVEMFGDETVIKHLSSEDMRSSIEADLLILPGGPSTPMADSLGKDGMQNIKSYVHNGGKLIGFCGGAYLCCKHVEFNAEGSPALKRERNIAFFEGTCTGPFNGKFDMDSYIGLEAIPLTYNDRKFHGFLNGGGTFKNAEQYDNVEVLLSYDNGEAAGVLCSVGKGKAALISPHIEYSPEIVNQQDPYISKYLELFISENQLRKDICREILSKLLD